METPKYQSLVSWIKNKIEAGELKYGEKLYSENELSEMFSFSRQTVRQAINVLVQEKYLESRQGSGTYIVYGTTVKSEPSMTIGVITTYVDAYIFPRIIRGIETVLAENGYSMQLAFTHNKVQNENRALNSMLAKGVDGLIIEPTKSGLPNPSFQLYKEIQQRGIPLLFINSGYPGLKIPHVSMNDRTAGRMAAEHLIALGHKRIAGVFKSDDYQGHLRYAGYLDALLKAGCEICDENVLWYATEDIADFPLYPQRLLDRVKDCTGLVCYNDEIAVQIGNMMKKSGVLIPDQLSLVSIDNSDLAELWDVPFTSVANPMDVLGRTAAQNLLNLIQDSSFKATVDFEPKLTQRGSVQRIL